MNLSELRETYYEDTAKASDISRQLGFAAIALIWAFRESGDGIVRVSPDLAPAAILVVLGLSMDLLQYVVRSAIWGIYNRRKERREIDQNAELELHVALNWPALFFFWGKITCVIAAYAFLLNFLVGRVL